MTKSTLTRDDIETTSDRSVTNTTRYPDQQSLKNNEEVATGSGQGVAESSETSAVSKRAKGYRFEVGDCIRVDRPDSAPWYGVIKWIGTLTLPGIGAAVTGGIEMVSHIIVLPGHYTINS